MSIHPPLLKLGPADARRAVSADAFATAASEEPWAYQRRAERLVVMSPERQRHVEGSRPWLKQRVVDWSQNPEVGELVVPNAWIRPDAATDCIGDLGVDLVADGPTLPIPNCVPNLMFEIVSPGQVAREQDYEQKRAESRRLGSQEYVIIDRRECTVNVLTLGPRGYRRRVLRAADSYISHLLPGLAISLAPLF